MKNFLLLILISIAGCNSNNSIKTPKKTESKNKSSEKFEINLLADKNDAIPIGEQLTIAYKIKDHSDPDSIKLSVDFKRVKTFMKGESLIWDTKNDMPGLREIQLTFYWGDSLTNSSSLKKELLSDIQPKRYTFRTLNKWPHNTKAYTQGLEFSEGYLYEGTGEYGKSMLYKIDLGTNEIIQSINLSEEVFGEGITLIGDKIYQLTWRSNIGFVYDKSSLKELYEFSYPTEGWGLTNNGTELIMSDGSEKIYFLDTEFIQETKRLQIYDDKGPVTHLNELEYINGLVYANIYGSNELVAFDSKSGKVLKRINLSGILNEKEVKTPIDVLNGIAWDAVNKKLIVTGKWWPYFFEIELIESKI